eukprot:jgi/Undpi1/4146/HiC_scaffold_16.g07513.m1
MRGLTPILLLLAAILGITAGHVINTHHHDGSRALAAVNDANEVDMFYRRLDPVGGFSGNCCGTCTLVTFFQVIIFLLIKVGDFNGGQLNPFVLTASGIQAVTIIIRITLTYTETTNGVTSGPLIIVFESIVEEGDWNPSPCSYIEEDCIVFENDDVILFAPDNVGGTGVLSIFALNEFTSSDSVTVDAESCDVRCQDAGVCDNFVLPPTVTSSNTIDLDPDGDGTDFGTIVQSVFNTGFCNPSIFDDPHVNGLRGQRYYWSGEDGGWYAFLSTQHDLQMNLRVTSHLPETFPERQLVTGVAAVTEGGHRITVDIVDPLDLAPVCQHPANAEFTSASCLVNGALRITVDGREEMPVAGEYHFDGGIHITGVNLPLECQRFGDYLMWGDLDEEEKLMHGRRNLRTTTSMFDWLLENSVMIAPPWCVKYLEELDGDVTALAGVESTHAVLRIESPNLSLRVNVGINSEQEQTLQDGRVVPTASFWQMDVRVEHAEGMATAKGMLGETARLVHDKETGKPVMTGLGVLRGDVEDYRVMHSLGTEFKQMFVREE